MNNVYSANDPTIINAKNMKIAEFGVVREAELYCGIKVGQHIFMSDDKYVICLESGFKSANPEKYQVQVKSTLTLQAIK